MTKALKKQSVDLGELQADFILAQKAHISAEKALKRAQDARDSAKVKASTAETALRDASRTVLG